MEASNEALSNTSSKLLLPPVSPLLCLSSSYSNFSPTVSEVSKNLMEVKSVHQHCSSKSVLIEEQPSWLDELLNEPDMMQQPVHKVHRRSASDSSAYLDAAVATFNMRQEYKFPNSDLYSPWSFQNFVPISKNASSFSEAPLNYGNSSVRDGITLLTQKRDITSERSDCSQAKSSASKAEVKRAKQQSAHRSRVRKLQYIAELERNVQVLQAEGSELVAKLEFLDQQNLILGMENRTLRQRLDSLTQEQLIKHLEQDMLERELLRLHTLYQVQGQQLRQQHQQPKTRRSKSRDSESRLGNHSKKNKETTSSSSGSLKELESHFASLALRPKENQFQQYFT